MESKTQVEREPRSVEEAKVIFWKEQREQIATNLAFAEMQREFLNTYQDEEVIGKEQVGEFGSSKGMREITAGEAKKKNNESIDKGERTLRGLEKLLAGK